MSHPLVWKEFRENRLAMLLGCLWVVGASSFWVQWSHARVPWAISKLLLDPLSMITPGLTMLMLGTARFFAERRVNTWEFLNAQPVSIRRAVAIKWAVPLALVVTFISLSSGIAWYPMTHTETNLAHVSFLQWISLHSAAAALAISILLLLDTMDWGEWLGVRATITFGLLLTFLWYMGSHDVRASRSVAWFCATTAVACVSTAVWAAPWIARESPLPNWRYQGNVSTRVFSHDGAWLWLQWRQMRFVTMLLLMPVPLILIIHTLALASSGIAREGVQRMIAQILENTTSWATSSLMVCCAGIIGWTIPLMEAQSNAGSFRCSLPVCRTRLQLLRLASAVGLVTLIFVPLMVLALLRVSFFQAAVAPLLVHVLNLYCVSVSVCVFLLTVITVGDARPSLTSLVLTIGGVCCSIYVMNHAVGKHASDLVWVVPASVAILCAAWVALPMIDRWREV